MYVQFQVRGWEGRWVLRTGKHGVGNALSSQCHVLNYVLGWCVNQRQLTHIIYSHSYCSENLECGRNQPTFGRSKIMDLHQARANSERFNPSILRD
jgi:hypothetical protein